MQSTKTRRGLLIAGAAVLLALTFILPGRFANLPLVFIVLICPLSMGAMMLGMRHDAGDGTRREPEPPSATSRRDDHTPPTDHV